MIIDNLEDFLKGIQEKRHYPQGLELNFKDKKIGDPELKAIASALQSEYCPQGVEIDLSDNEIDAQGAEAIAAALQSGHCPQGLRLHLSSNRIGAEGAKIFAATLQSGRCPQGLWLNLTGNEIGIEGAKTFAVALQSGHCPQGFVILLRGNKIDAEGAEAFAAALQSGYCPQGLTLVLEGNPAVGVAVEAFAIALQSGRCPQGLKLNLGSKNKKQLEKAWKSYYADQQEKFLKCGILQHGHQQASNPLLGQLPQDILKQIYRYILPATPVLAKMKEISAKVFRTQYAMPRFSGQSIEGNQLDQDLEVALSAKTITERADKIKAAIENFLQKELGMLEKGTFAKLPTVALLCKYHLFAENRVHEDPNQSGHFQLKGATTKKQRLKNSI